MKTVHINIVLKEGDKVLVSEEQVLSEDEYRASRNKMFRTMTWPITKVLRKEENNVT